MRPPRRDGWTHIIIGGGSAGCLLANRLAASSSAHRVLLLEAGGSDVATPRFQVPAGYLACAGSPRADWCWSLEAENGLNGRALRYPRGRGLGGCSSINGMIFSRGQREDFAAWASATGSDAWNWPNVLRLSKKHERYHGGASGVHGADGEVYVEKQRLSWPLLTDVQSAVARQLRIPLVDDFNTGDNRGVGLFEVTQRAGRRWSCADAFLREPPLPSTHSDRQTWIGRYLREIVSPRPQVFPKRLTIATGFQVDRLLWGDKSNRQRAVGVCGWWSGSARRSSLEEFHVDLSASTAVILCAGAIASPMILMRSGVGPEPQLRAHGIDVRLASDAVGSNMSDHLQIRTVFTLGPNDGAVTRHSLNRQIRNPLHALGIVKSFVVDGAGPLAMAPSQLGAFATVGVPPSGRGGGDEGGQQRPNVEFHIQPLSLEAFGELLHPFDALTVSVCNLRPESVGTVRLRSADPRDPPRIRANYLDTEADRQVAAESIRAARYVMQDAALQAAYQPGERKPGLAWQTSAELASAAGDIATTIFHPCCTVRMGRHEDDQHRAPLDPNLRLKGTDGLYVCDASAMPCITSGNTNEPTLILAEGLAEHLAAS